MDFDAIWNIFKLTAVAAVTSFGLNYLFPPAKATTNVSDIWIELFSALVQMALYVTIAENTAHFIDNDEIPPVAYIAYMWGFWFMPGMTAKVTNWFNSLHLPKMDSGGNCSSCPSTSS